MWIFFSSFRNKLCRLGTVVIVQSLGVLALTIVKLYSVNYLKNIEITDDVTQPIKWIKLRYNTLDVVS